MRSIQSLAAAMCLATPTPCRPATPRTPRWGSFTVVTVSRDDGKEATEVGRYTDVSRKVGGKWVCVVDHASDDPPAAT